MSTTVFFSHFRILVEIKYRHAQRGLRTYPRPHVYSSSASRTSVVSLQYRRTNAANRRVAVCDSKGGGIESRKPVGLVRTKVSRRVSIFDT